MQTYQDLLSKHKKYYQDNHTQTYEHRVKALNMLKAAIIKHESVISQALFDDLGKSAEESYLTEIGLVLSEIAFMIKHLKKWMKIKKVKTPLSLFPAKSYTFNKPYGTVLVLAPWNYPFQLSMTPLIGAIAAGNTVVVKPSPHAKNTALVIESIIKSIYDDAYVSVVTGSDQEADALLGLPFDYIFFTGSIRIGKHVMEKASKHLIPVTLELGGKSPCIIGNTKDLEQSVKRIVFGKFINAGQTCIAPDYVLIKEALKDQFKTYFDFYVKQFYGDKPLENDAYPKIISERHHLRLKKYLSDGTVISGGNYNQEKIEPTLLDRVTFDSDVMQDEIFGPILPLITYQNLNDEINKLKKLPKPLALYLFSDDKNEVKHVLNELSFGGAGINDTLMHFANHHLPFGGVGQSGMGSYHGKNSFDTFSHKESILKRGKLDLSFRYHPMDKKRHKIIRFFLK